MTEFKNVRPHPLDVGGRLIPAEARVALDPADPAVVEAAAAGHLVATVTAEPLSSPEPAPRRRGGQNPSDTSTEEN